MSSRTTSTHSYAGSVGLYQAVQVISALALAVVLAAGTVASAFAEPASPSIVQMQWFGDKPPRSEPAEPVLSPLKQIKDGTPADKILCSDHTVLVQGISGRPACVYPDTAQTLVRLGWTQIRITPASPHTLADRDVPLTLPTIPSGIADANNAFAVEFYRQISGDYNVFFSPSSIYVAFSALYEGARQNTAAQMEDVFGFEPEVQERHSDMERLLTSLNQNDPFATLNMANALWIAEQYSLYESYVDILRGTYLAHVENVDFLDPEDGVRKINQWASDNTNERIKKVIGEGDVDSSTLAVLNNTIYFKGMWRTQFLEEHTMEGDFWTGTDSMRANFMNMHDSLFNYAESDGVQVLKLPYRGDRLSMLVALPDKAVGIKDLEDSLSADLIKKWHDSMQKKVVIVSIPKFEMSASFNLIRHLASMGMQDVFSPEESDLTGMADVSALPGNIYVSKATQGAYVKVNEEGTEAAAVTTAMVGIKSEIPKPSFIADHPFIFLIQDDESGMILFMGKIMDPK